jgi:hypothetical protein
MSRWPWGWPVSNSGAALGQKSFNGAEPRGDSLVGVKPMEAIHRGVFVSARPAADPVAILGLNADPV